MSPRHPAPPCSPHAYRGFAREFLKDLEAVRPRAILDLIHSAGRDARERLSGAPVGQRRASDPPAESWRVEETESPGSGGGALDDAASVRTGATSQSSSGATAKLTAAAQTRGSCPRCGYLTSRAGDDGDSGAGAQSCGGGPAAPPHLLPRRAGGGGPRLCQACTLLEGLRAGTPRVGIVSERQARRMRDGAAALESSAAAPA